LKALVDWTQQDFAVRLVVHTGGTVRHLIPVSAVERGLLVTHTNDCVAEAVAEFTVGAIIAARRQMITSAIRTRVGQEPLSFENMHRLPGSVVGVISASTVGRKVLALLKPWNVKPLLYDPYCSREVAESYGAELVPLRDLMERSDVVTVHAPLLDETRGMVGAVEFSAMRDGTLFVNCARGQLTDQEALLRELQSGRISALLDVTDPAEPLPADSPFLQLENCIVLPHIAGSTIETRRLQGSQAVDEALRFLAHKPQKEQVTRDRWDIIA
jgi:phosphoglycerate dehydrogenase-like enzyme